MYLVPPEKNSSVYRLKPQGILSRKNGLFLLIGVFFLLLTVLLSPPWFVHLPQDEAWGITLLVALPFAAGLLFFLDFISMFLILPSDDPVQPVGLVFFVLTIGFFLLLAIIFLQTGNLPAGWSLFLQGSTLFLLGLFLLACIRSLVADWRAKRSIDEFSLTLSEQSITEGTPFLLRYVLSFRRAIPVDDLSIRLNCSYHVKVSERDEIYGGGPAYAIREKTILMSSTGPFLGNPTVSLGEDLSWSLDLTTPFCQSCEKWWISVHIHPHNGSAMSARYPVQIMAGRPALS